MIRFPDSQRVFPPPGPALASGAAAAPVAPVAKFNRKNVDLAWLEKCLRFRLDPVTCLNYQFCSFVSVQGIFSKTQANFASWSQVNMFSIELPPCSSLCSAPPTPGAHATSGVGSFVKFDGVMFGSKWNFGKIQSNSMKQDSNQNSNQSNLTDESIPGCAASGTSWPRPNAPGPSRERTWSRPRLSSPEHDLQWNIDIKGK